MKCEGKIGCHYCCNFLQILEAKLEKVLEAVNAEATPNMVYTIKDVIQLIAAHKKGG